MTTNTISPGTTSGISNEISNHAESFQQALGSSTITHPSLSGTHVITAVIGNHGGVEPKLSPLEVTVGQIQPTLSEPSLHTPHLSVITAVTPHNTTGTTLPPLSEPTLNTSPISVITTVTQENHIKNSDL